MRWLVLAMTLLFATELHAEEMAFYVIGVGADSCERFIAAAEEQPPGTYKAIGNPDGPYVNAISKYQQWMMGYVSAVNAARGDEGMQIKLDLTEMDSWMRNWCSRNQRRTVFHALQAFVKSH
ncbi:hypothetical protein [Bradyrhizobium sp. SRS-191]|uniref:hypothetical protein n=1 Tax=Bradyrhizobium sp. SRS-191 TaxID=2962606 RepID=UPI00211EA91A|nr:hypothetical protein [Bradyrhizobium sp. SRS-191]